METHKWINGVCKILHWKSIIVVYSPTNEGKEKTNELFIEQLQVVINNNKNMTFCSDRRW